MSAWQQLTAWLTDRDVDDFTRWERDGVFDADHLHAVARDNAAWNMWFKGPLGQSN